LSNLLIRSEAKRSRELVMKCAIAKKLRADPRGVATEPHFTNQLLGIRRQLSVNRKSTPLLAMKYAISENIFFSVQFKWSLRPGTSKPRTTAGRSGEVSHEVCNWQKLFPPASHACVRAVGGE
jgi:hypothetical protein